MQKKIKINKIKKIKKEKEDEYDTVEYNAENIKTETPIGNSKDEINKYETPIETEEFLEYNKPNSIEEDNDDEYCFIYY